MARKLTKKQKGFVKTYVETGNATEAVRKHYEVSNDLTAGVMGNENLSKPKIIDELRKLGFNSDNAKSVVAEILNDTTAEHRDRLKAAGEVFEVMGDYAPIKTQNAHMIVEASPQIKALAEKLREAD